MSLRQGIVTHLNMTKSGNLFISPLRLAVAEHSQCVTAESNHVHDNLSFCATADVIISQSSLASHMRLLLDTSMFPSLFLAGSIQMEMSTLPFQNSQLGPGV